MIRTQATKMSTPAQYLPPILSNETIQALLSSLGLPAAETISRLTVAAAYHSIYLLTFPASSAPRLAPARGPDGEGAVELVLRVAGRHLPGIKTANEVAAMRWVRARAPRVPVPAVVRADASEDNPLGHEFTLLERARGVGLDEAWGRLGAAERRGVVAQMARFVGEMHAHEWTAVGGLRCVDDDDGGGGGAVEVGRVVDETFWQAPDVERFWGPGESVESLNVAGPYASYAALCAACIERSARGVARHESLAWMRDLLPRLQALVGLLLGAGGRVEELGLNDGRLVLAHRDLHMANIMVDPLSGEITAILDWEFAGVVPASRWNPVRAFLWNMKQGDESRVELMEVLAEICSEMKISVLEDARANEYQEAMQAIVNYLRAVVEVCPRGERLDAARDWRKMVEEKLSKFGL